MEARTYCSGFFLKIKEMKRVDVDARVLELFSRNLCCSQIVAKVGLELYGKDNPEMVSAMKGLCYGVSAQRICGALSAGACLLALYGASKNIPEFTADFEKEFGNLDCQALVGEGGSNPMLCMRITAFALEHCSEIIEEIEINENE